MKSTNYVSEKEARESKDGIVLTEEDMGRAYSNENFDITNLPDIPKLVEDISSIMRFITTDENIQLKKTDNEKYRETCMLKFPIFSDKYYSLFQKIINGDDIIPLCSMLEQLNKVKQGHTTIDKAEETIGDELEEKYIHPILSKDQIKKLQKDKEVLKKKMKKI
jgi:hypothetical protein